MKTGLLGSDNQHSTKYKQQNLLKFYPCHFFVSCIQGSRKKLKLFFLKTTILNLEMES